MKRSNTKRSDDFLDLFAYDEITGSFVYKADACANRHTRLVKEEQLNTKDESHTSFGDSAWREEQRLEAQALEIISRTGIKPQDESLEDFVNKHSEEQDV